MAERSKALRSGRSPLLWAWVRIPLLTNVFGNQVSTNPTRFSAIQWKAFSDFDSKIVFGHVPFTKWCFSWKSVLEKRGIDPRTSRMLSARSTIWATPPFDMILAVARNLGFQIGGIFEEMYISALLNANLLHSPIFSIRFGSWKCWHSDKINIPDCSTQYFWRIGVSIPVPLECESSALPSELIPLAFWY